MSYCRSMALVKSCEGIHHAVTLPCRAWTCPDCAERRKRQLTAEGIGGTPRLFITLTSRRRPNITPTQAAAKLVHSWRLLRLRIMRRYKWSKLPFLAVFEPHASGWPHLHILARCAYIDWQFMSSVMAELDDSPHVHVRLIRDVGGQAAYVAKYTSKGAGKFGTCRRYWKSRDYELRKKPEPRDDAETRATYQVEKLALNTWCYRMHSRGFHAWILEPEHACAFNPRIRAGPK